MRIAEITQTVIHKLEVGGGQKYLGYLAAALIVLLLGLRFDFHGYKNMSTPEGMDSAQLARNIAEGNGYTTQFIRPLSLRLVENRNVAKLGSSAPADLNANDTNFPSQIQPDFARIKTVHPDIANPPVYPVVLAGLMKILPFHYAVQLEKSFWSDNGRFAIYEPDFLIALFNQLLLLAAAVIAFFIARKLFDKNVAKLSAALMIGCNLLWRFSVSGISTMLLLVIFLALTWCLLKIEELARAAQPNPKNLFGWVIAAGILTALGALTRYAFGWTIIPIILFLIFFSGQKRALNAIAAFAAFTILLAPWLIRNYAVSGTPFGTEGFAIAEGTFLFPQYQLERSIQPDFSNLFQLALYRHKLWDNGVGILTNQLPTLGGSWAAMFFLVGLLLQFRSAAAQRMRYFLLTCLAVFIVVQALGQTQLSVESPEVNSENLLVLLAPLVFIYGSSFFFTLLDQINFPVLQLRYVVTAGFILLCCLQMRIVLWTQTTPLAYPPYYPPEIQQVSRWMKNDELMMSDAPWAVAWYGNRQCVWLTTNDQDGFAAINHNLKAIDGIFFTTETLDEKFLSEMARGNNNGWEHFILNVGMDEKFPPGFYLQSVKILGSGIFITDRSRWLEQ